MITYKGKTYRNFTVAQLERIEREYPKSNTASLADELGVKVHSIHNVAHRLGLYKDKSFLVSMASDRFKETGTITRFKKGSPAWNNGMKGLKIGGEVTQFKPGHLPHNTKIDGFISLRKDKNGHKYQYIRVEKAKWELLHRHIWRQHNGDIPAGCNIQFKDRDQMNCDIENLYIISRKKQIYNVLQPYAVGAFNHCTNLKAQNYE